MRKKCNDWENCGFTQLRSLEHEPRFLTALGALSRGTDNFLDVTVFDELHSAREKVFRREMVGGKAKAK